MRHLGATNVEVTQFQRDGGVDVLADGFVVQVKNLTPNAGVPISAIRDLAGVAAVQRRRGAMFTSGQLTADGRAFADQAGIALFRYDAVVGTLTPVNPSARSLMTHGMR